ncbi:MAG: carboxymuconolactone decarboxylase family protein [Ignavibacteriota bacterium]
MSDLRTQSLLRASTLATRPELRQELVHELRQIESSNSVTASELYEAFLQLYLFAGFPAALEAVRALSKIFDLHHKAGDSKITQSAPYTKYFESGTELYQRVYADKAIRVREEMIRLSPELAEWALLEGYGKTLSREGLDGQTRELCIVAILTQLSWERQLFSHLLGARNLGATAQQISEAILIGANGDEAKLSSAEQLRAKLV